MSGLGDEFRAAREARRLSLSDVSEQIHIRSVYLQSIEDEEWSTSVAPVYVRGFVRTYARFLGLDAERAAAYVQAALETEHRPLPDAPAYAQPERRRSVWLWLATGVAACLVAFVGYDYVLLEREGKTASPAAIVGLASAKHPAGGTLDVRWTKASRVAITIDGGPALAGEFPAGTRRAFHGKLASIHASNGAALDLTVNGKAFGSLGASAEASDRTISLAEQ